MNKLFALVLFSTISVTSVFAANHDGFNDYTAKKATVAEALKMNDDSYVTVQGNIVKKISDDKYSFKDSTGTITVEINKDKWSGVSADTKDRLEIVGEIEKKNNQIHLDVESVKKVSR